MRKNSETWRRLWLLQASSVEAFDAAVTHVKDANEGVNVDAVVSYFDETAGGRSGWNQGAANYSGFYTGFTITADDIQTSNPVLFLKWVCHMKFIANSFLTVRADG